MSIKKKYRYLLLLLICVLSVSACFFYQQGSQEEYEWLIEPMFERATNFYCGVAWVQDRYGKIWNLINKSGKVLVKDFEASSILPYDRNTGLALMSASSGSGYVNLSGDIVIPPEYQYISWFQNGVARIKKDDLYGAVDYSGKIIFPITCENVAAFNANLFAVQKEGKWGYVNAMGENITDFVFDDIGYSSVPSGPYPVAVDEKWGLIDAKGEWVLPASYDAVCPPARGEETGLIGVIKQGNLGYVDAEGKLVVDFHFDGTEKGTFFYYAFSEGRAVVRLPDSNDPNDWNGVIDETGNVLFRLPGAPRGFTREGYLLVLRHSDKRYGLVDRSGKWRPLPSQVGFKTSKGDVFSGWVSDGVLCVRTREKTRRYKEDMYGYLQISP